MADGAYRFHQAGSGQFYNTQHNQHHRNLNRASSPHSRRPFSHDTPSPSRSPVASAAGHTFNMFNQNGYHGQHVMMNGGQNHQRYTGGFAGSKYQGPHNNHHNQMSHHQNQHHGNNFGHQHTLSSGTFQHATPHISNYGQEHAQNGNTDGMQQDELDEMYGEHWREQMRIANELKMRSSPNSHAKQSGKISSVSGLSLDEPQVEERPRALTTNDDDKLKWTALDCGGQGLRSLSTPLFRYSFLRRLYLGHNKLDQLPREIASLKKLAFLDVSYNQLIELPEEIGMLTNLEELFLVGNQIQTLPAELGYLYKLRMLAVVNNPLDEEILAKIREDGTVGLIRFLRENMPDLEPPQDRPWHKLEDVSNAASEPEKFTALSYNILCEKYATTTQYAYVAERVLSWEYRRDLLLDEIRNRDPDIVCLQELDRASYDNFFRSSLAHNGYKGYFAQKGRADTAGDQAKFVDGCGTFWKDKKYICLDQQQLVLGRKAVERPGVKASADMINRVFMRDDIATIALLENRVTGSRLIVGNGHFFWDPAFKDVRLIQVVVLMEELKRLSEKYAKTPPCTNKKLFSFTNADGDESQQDLGPSLEYDSGTQIPMIICGDFNSNPHSAVYHLLSQRKLESQHPDLVDWNYGALTEFGMEHPFSLKSAYGAIGELPFTNYTPAFQDILDYVWYSSNSLRVTGLLGEIDKSYLSKVPGFPNQHYPSDHVALVTEFVVQERKKIGKVAEHVDFGPSSNRDRKP